MKLLIFTGPPATSHSGHLSSSKWNEHEQHQLVDLGDVFRRYNVKPGLSIEQYSDLLSREIQPGKREVLLIGLPRGDEQLKVLLEHLAHRGIVVESVSVLDRRFQYVGEWKYQSSAAYNYYNFEQLSEVIDFLNRDRRPSSTEI